MKADGVLNLLKFQLGSLPSTNSFLIYMMNSFAPMLCAGLLMFVKAPDLLRSRLREKETQSDQKDVIRYNGVMFLAAFVIAGLNYHFDWSVLSQPVIRAAVIVFLLAYCMFGEVLRESSKCRSGHDKTYKGHLLCNQLLCSLIPVFVI